MIIDTLKNIFNITAATNTNWFIYYFKRIPLIGKLLPDSIYENAGLKKIVALFVTITNIIGKIFGKAIFICLFVILPVVSIEETASLRNVYFLHIFFMLNLIGSLISSTIFENKRDKFICIRLIRMDARKYIISTLLYHNLVNFISFLPTLIITSLLLGGSALQGLLLAILIICFDFIGEAVHIFVFSKTNVVLSKKILLSLTIGLISIIASYVPVVMHKPIPFNHVSIMWPSYFVILLLGVMCIGFTLKYRRYHDIAAATLKADIFTVDTKKAMGEARFANVAMREKDFTVSELNTNKYQHRKGYSYLNAIFFDRHKRLLIKPVLIRLCIIGLLFLGIVLASVFGYDFPNNKLNPGKILPVFVFVMYFASIGEQVCKAMFYNCDNSLLRYSFYRDKKTILANFRIRLFRLAGLNLIIAIAISAAVIGFVVITGMNWPMMSTLFFILTILLLSLFFSVHYLFLYYVFQPYTSELGMKNPFFSVINSAVYLVCFFCLKIKSAPTYFTLVVLISTITYIIIALFMVYKYAPKNFRVK